jgi:hypothetical protein
MAVLAQLFAVPLTRALAGGDGAVAQAAAQWLRIASIGAPGILLAMAGNGWMRGVQDTRRPVRYVLGANLVSALLCPLLVYPLGLGLAGSAVANVVAQLIGGVLFVRALAVERVPLAPRPAVLRRQLVVSRDLVVRGAAFQVCFISAAAVAARFGAAALGAHQIALQLWMFTALALDAVAIAAQSLVGATLGAGDTTVARDAANRIGRIGAICGVAFAVVIGGWRLGAARPVLARPGGAGPGPHRVAVLRRHAAAGRRRVRPRRRTHRGRDVRFLRNLTIVRRSASSCPRSGSPTSPTSAWRRLGRAHPVHRGPPGRHGGPGPGRPVGRRGRRPLSPFNATCTGCAGSSSHLLSSGVSARSNTQETQYSWCGMVACPRVTCWDAGRRA